MRKLLLSLVMMGALAACSDSPVQPTAADPGSDAPRIIAVYDESQFAAAGITEPSVDAITRAFGSNRVNAVSRLSGVPAGPSASLYPYECDRQYLRPDIYDDPCQPDCYTNPYGWNCGGDPCVWNPSLPECQPAPPVDPTPPTPTPTPVTAQFSYGSDAAGPVWVTRGGILLKEVTLTSWSIATANVASTSLSASFRNVGADSGYGCGNASQQFDASSASGSGSPLTLQSSRVANYLGTIKWEVWGTHGFTPVSGASGGGTFYSSDFVCG